MENMRSYLGKAINKLRSWEEKTSLIFERQLEDLLEDSFVEVFLDLYMVAIYS